MWPKQCKLKHATVFENSYITEDYARVMAWRAFCSRYQKAACKLDELVTGKFEWKQEHSEAFEVIKNMLSSDTVQAYFDPQAEHELHIDGCPVGLAATLTQRKPGEQCW